MRLMLLFILYSLDVTRALGMTSCVAELGGGGVEMVQCPNLDSLTDLGDAFEYRP